MPIGDIVYSLITLLLIVVFIFSPLLRKLMKSADKHRKGHTGSAESITESVDSLSGVEKTLEERESHIDFTEPKPVNHTKNTMYEQGETAVEKIDRMAPLKRAVIWKEILDKPVGLRDLF